MRKEKRVVEIQEEIAILQDDHKIILEKGDKIKVLKEYRLDRKAAQLLKDKGFDAYMEYRFGGPSGYYDPENYTLSEIGEAITMELADVLSDIASDVSDPEFESNYNYKTWTEQVLFAILTNIKNRNYILN